MAAGIHPIGRYRGETVIWVGLVSIVAVALSLGQGAFAAPVDAQAGILKRRAEEAAKKRIEDEAKTAADDIAEKKGAGDSAAKAKAPAAAPAQNRRVEVVKQ